MHFTILHAINFTQSLRLSANHLPFATVSKCNLIAFFRLCSFHAPVLCGLYSIGFQNKKSNNDGWDDEPAPAKSNGKRKTDDWDDNDDWGSSSKRAPTNGNRFC